MISLLLLVNCREQTFPILHTVHRILLIISSQRGSTMTATNHDGQLGEIDRTMLNELNCTFGVSFSRFHCCGCHGRGLWPSWYMPITTAHYKHNPRCNNQHIQDNSSLTGLTIIDRFKNFLSGMTNDVKLLRLCLQAMELIIQFIHWSIIVFRRLAFSRINSSSHVPRIRWFAIFNCWLILPYTLHRILFIHMELSHLKPEV